MAFENKTIEEINNLIVSGLEIELNTKFKLLPKAFVRVIAKVLSGVYITLYKQQAWILLQMFVATASFDEIEVLGRKIRPLVMWGDLAGIGEPENATQFKGKIKVKATNVGSNFLQGTQFLNPATGKIYITTETVLLRDVENIVGIKCSESGIAGNLVIGDELISTSPLVNVVRNAVCTEIIANAEDEESEDSYRSRISARWKNPPQGGALGDYRRWANEVPGVLQSYIYKDDNSAAGVIIYVVANNDSRIAEPELLVAVGNACDYDPETGEGRKPIGAVIDPDNDGTYANIKPCDVLKFDVYINNYTETTLSSFIDEVKSEIQNYFLSREPFVRGLSTDIDRADRISAINVGGIVNDVAEGGDGYFESLDLKKDDEKIEFYILQRGEIAQLGKLYVNGEEV